MRLAMILLALAAAGCASPEPVAAPAAPRESVPPTAPATQPSPHPAPIDPPSPIGPPTWRPGDWWRWRIDAQGSSAFEVTTVLARTEGATHIVGFQDQDAGLRALAHHAIVAGRVDGTTLAWTVHDQPARLLAFPLSDGATWEGAFEGDPISFTARAVRAQAPEGEVDAFEAIGTRDGAIRIRVVYAPGLGSMLALHVHYGGEAPFASATLLAKGEGASRVILIETRDAALGFSALPPPPHMFAPQAPAAFDVPPTATHVVLACFAGGDGAQRAAAAGPTGERVACGRDGGEAFSMGVAAATAGTWRLALQAVGGWIETEVVHAVIEEVEVRSVAARRPDTFT